MIQTYITPTKSICNIELNFPIEYLGNKLSYNEFKSMIEDAEKENSITLKESKKKWTKRRKAFVKITK